MAESCDPQGCLHEVEAPSRHLVLVGLMGSGKSTVGALVAKRLGQPHIDTDAQLEHAAASTIEEIWARGGEEEFRCIETAVLGEALARSTPAVISTGGGVVLLASNRELLRRSGNVVWLRARPETLANRLGDGGGRPLLRSGLPLGSHVGVLERIEHLEGLRRPLYEEVADAVVDVDDRDLDEVVSAVLKAVEELAR